WLWEAVASSYLPLLPGLERAPLTLSLTPVLCDQLEDRQAMARCRRFLTEVRAESHRLDIEHYGRSGQDAVVQALEASAAHYASAAAQLDALEAQDGLMAALGAFAGWTSAASHAVLPLLASDSAISLQVRTGTAAHRRRFGEWRGGFWLPECAYAPWLDEPLEEAGVAATCVELTGLVGPGDARHLRPLQTEAGPVLWPIDRQIMSLVWSPSGYPRGAAYRNYHGLTPHHHRAWRNDGAAYDPTAAAAAVAQDARQFVEAVGHRVRQGGVCVCALDTELLGHWWHEGIQWLSAVIDESARQGLALTTLDAALENHEPEPAPAERGVTSWGEGGDLRTWSGPQVADLAWQARSGELRVLRSERRPSDRALRELLALQASDWAFQITGQLAGEYPLQRARAHAQALAAALDPDRELDEAVRNLAPELVGWSG
ncbi:MAG TPA: 1,4-alpha-glucan branching protein domain-containing protein, partial [Solirubrobacteraceae bacterium]|nr:1,4-alpha-glucan branching protein domain-containing protein [Solirubrobacteraceae bacterium]